MGVYLRHLISTLDGAGFAATILLFRNCRLAPDDLLLTGHEVRFADFDPEQGPLDTEGRVKELHGFTSYLTSLIEQDEFDVYLDGTPFLGPTRLDLFSCPVVSVCYDFIPLRYPSFYLQTDSTRVIYQNGLARLAKADAVICISETVRSEIRKYLGSDADSVITVYPRLDEAYESVPTSGDSPFARSYIFSIVGGHKSKNPECALRVFEGLSELKELDIRLNAPTPDQRERTLNQISPADNIILTDSIPDQNKRALQAHAACVAHFSIEEGFGIPCLEAIFLGRKILALDVPINREIMDAGWDYRTGAVLLQPLDTSRVPPEEFRAFFRHLPDEEFYRRIRARFHSEWTEAPEKVAGAIRIASDRFRTWRANLKAAIHTSLPGSSCGVADYSVAYVRSADFGFVVFCSAGNQEFLTPLPHVRVASYLDFARFRARYPDVKCLFNFAFSDELFPGIDLMRSHAAEADVILIHERRYFDGLLAMLLATGRINELLLDISKEEDASHKTELAIRCAYHPAFNAHSPQIGRNSPISSAWLQQIPARFVSHLSVPVLDEMQRLAKERPGDVVNDLADIEDAFEFAPLGIDDRSGPGVGRSARRLRLARGIQPADVLVGHFGLILNDLRVRLESHTKRANLRTSSMTDAA